MPHIHEKIDFVVSAFIVHENKVLLVHHRELEKWLPVGGHIELDEDSDEALLREIKEECGLGAADLEFIDNRARFDAPYAKPLLCPQYVDVHPVKGNHRHLVLIYFVKALRGNVRLAEKEHHEIKWFSAEDLKNNDIMPSIRFYAKEALRMLGSR